MKNEFLSNLMRVIEWFLLIIVLCVSSAQARIYTCKDEDGNTIYSDAPNACSQPEEIKVDSLPTLIETKPLVVPKTTTSTKKQETKSIYKSLVITSPSAEENIRSNEGDVTISFQATPVLKARNGHKFILMLGGKEVYRGTNSSVTLKNVDRGTHLATVKILAANGQNLISSDAVQFTLHRYSSLQSGGNPGSGSGSSP